MRIAALLPYAAAAVAVVVASAIALLGTVRVPDPSAGVAVVSPAPVTSTGRRAELSEQRMAYWRQAASGSLELWVSDLDGGRRWTIATAAADADIGLTRWSADGTAVAYRVANATIGISRLDGTIGSLTMPAPQRQARWRIANYEWSLDATHIAVTLRAGGGLSNESDVWVASATHDAAWERVTTLGDAYAGPWIDAHRLFIESASGLLAVLDLRTKGLRAVTGIAAVSPQIGRDGRVWFIGGGAVTADVASQPVATGWVWSATLAGDELRREVAAEHGQARLFGILADGRAVIGVPGGVYVAGEGLVPLVFAGAGSVRRVHVSEDGKRVVGLTDSRILRIEPLKVPRSLTRGQLPPADAATTVLSGIREPDVWTARKTVEPARSPAQPVQPAALRSRTTFMLGHAVWELLPDGSATPLVTERGSLHGARPSWSPTGERVAVMYTEVGERQPSALVIGAAGPVRWRLPRGSHGLAWSPDGSQVTFWIPTGTRSDQFNTHSFDPATARSLGSIPGRAIWAGTARVVLSDGEFEVSGGTATGIRVAQRVEVVSGASRRTITDARRLASAAALRSVPDAARIPLITQIAPTSDPDHMLVTLSRVGGTQGQTTRTPALVVLRVSDGEPVHVMPIPIDVGPFDLAWSPTEFLVGYGTTEIVPATGASLRRAVVIDPSTGSVRLRVEGRFAGWSADGAWAYVAREDGLYAYRVGSDADPVRVSPLGVIVSAAPAR